MTVNPITNTTTSPINVNGTAANVSSDGSIKTGNAATSQNQFLLLLVNELQNQDPTAPTDQTQTLSQLAQFSSLQQMQNLNQTLSASSSFNQVAQSAALIGKTVSTATATSPGISGVVTSVALQGTTTYLEVNGQAVDASTITGISPTIPATGATTTAN